MQDPVKLYKLIEDGDRSLKQVDEMFCIVNYDWGWDRAKPAVTCYLNALVADGQATKLNTRLDETTLRKLNREAGTAGLVDANGRLNPFNTFAYESGTRTTRADRHVPIDAEDMKRAMRLYLDLRLGPEGKWADEGRGPGSGGEKVR